MTTLTILWPHDGTRELSVVVDAELPAYGPLERRIRSIAEVARAHGGLRLLLENALGATHDVTVWETVGGATTVRLTPRGATSAIRP